MNDDRVFQLLAEINPVPDPDGLDSPIALADTEEMRGAMATIERTEREQTHAARSEGTSRKRGLAIASAAAAVVLIVGAGLWAFTGSSDTELASTPAGLATTYLDARNNNDPEAALAVLSSNAAFDEVPIIADIDDLGPRFEWMSIRGIRLDHTCTETAPGTVSEVRCTYEGVERLNTALGQPPLAGSFVFRINDGQIISVRHIFPIEVYSPNVFDVFVQWLDAEHPGAFDTIYRVEDDAAIGLTTPEALDLMDGYLEEFEASRG
jgi:hypothetical protein